MVRLAGIVALGVIPFGVPGCATTDIYRYEIPIAQGDDRPTKSRCRADCLERNEYASDGYWRCIKGCPGLKVTPGQCQQASERTCDERAIKNHALKLIAVPAVIVGLVVLAVLFTSGGL